MLQNEQNYMHDSDFFCELLKISGMYTMWRRGTILNLLVSLHVMGLNVVDDFT